MRGNIYPADLNPSRGLEQAGIRPVKYLSKINYTYLTPSCLLPLAFCLSLLGN
jgi:mRNA-degrading endonuclease toxin of MazEF toxin-antitoxin module